MKKILPLILGLLLFQGISFAKDILQFDFPNDGWHKVDNPKGLKSKKMYVPVNQTAENYNEMLVFSEKIIKTEGINAMVILQKQLGKDKNNYRDIFPQYIVQEENDTMAAWCSQMKNTCAIERAFKGNEGIVLVMYINKSPHYSQNMFSQWSNILAAIRVFDKNSSKTTSNLIELD